jgi:SanA protein
MSPRRLRILPLLTVTGFSAGLFFLAVVFLCDRHVERWSAFRHTDELGNLPDSEVGLVLGCAATVAEGRPNLYFSRRIDAAASLYHSGKVRLLLVSGDNGRKDYDETAQMAGALMKRGVPPERIHRDHAGFDTLDSVVRAKKVFGLDRFIIVSQQFHNERALYIAGHRGIDAFGWNAGDVHWNGSWKTRVREKLARVKTVLDIHLLGSEPRYLGDRIALGDAG